MISFDHFTSSEAITIMLIRLRTRLAHDRNQKHIIHLHCTDPNHNYHNAIRSKSEDFICSLFPSRKKWKQPSLKNRFKKGVARNTDEKNIISLSLTIKFYRQHHPDESFLSRLDSFIEEIQRSIHFEGYKLGSPTIIPKLKDEIQNDTLPNVCRPIASYGLKDKIILSLTNRYLSSIFDETFCDESFAFRSRRNIGGVERVPTHHDPVEKILLYRNEHISKKLWVSECDMKKFFDTVNHSIIKKELRKFFNLKSTAKYLISDLTNAKRILYDYLDSYTFNKNVFPLNDEPSFFKKYRIKNGIFNWVESELLNEGFYKKIKNAKIGIPQGGALSGLIANVVLHSIDKKVLAHQDGNLLYVRFCDDMLIIHPSEKTCGNVFDEYLKGLKAKKLVPHLHVMPPFLTAREFWGEKSKKCYSWDSNSHIGSPWIGFVGYEVHYSGHLRVRKSSLVKEMKKQFKVVGELKKILLNPHCRSSNRTIYESIASRLIGMSVGRVNLWNYSTMKNEMCWLSGYRLLSDNKYSRIQLRRLDSSRSKLLFNFKRRVDKMEQRKLNEKPINSNQKSRRIFYGKPFSYYYHVISKGE